MEVVDSDTNQWLVDEQEEATRPSTSRNIAGSIKTKEFDSILYGPIVDYSFRNLETLSDCVKLTPRTGFRPNEYTENKKLKSCSLRLSHNRLCDLSGLQQVLIQCTKLQILNLHGNQISELYEVDKLASLPHLRSLTLHGNPLELVKGYRSYVVGTVPQLKSLDYSTITKQDRSTATVLKSFTKRKRVARRKYDD
ncbi:leucine rich repeat containing 51 isoform X2 [Rhincodon typus]|uniref:leucine rich repeat containing 51 isoform X2 n=1 Tax=Rhincodon typus TaxID=259920 RepID=UPI00202E8EF7|nr:leucine rich repeat containing 51 isoform X2 [Rhincodon typus]